MPQSGRSPIIPTIRLFRVRQIVDQAGQIVFQEIRPFRREEGYGPFVIRGIGGRKPEIGKLSGRGRGHALEPVRNGQVLFRRRTALGCSG